MGNRLSQEPARVSQEHLTGPADQVVPNGYADTEMNSMCAGGANNGVISLDKLTRGRLGDSFELSEDFLCNSPTSLSEVPVIECFAGELHSVDQNITHNSQVLESNAELESMEDHMPETGTYTVGDRINPEAEKDSVAEIAMSPEMQDFCPSCGQDSFVSRSSEDPVVNNQNALAEATVGATFDINNDDKPSEDILPPPLPPRNYRGSPRKSKSSRNSGVYGQDLDLMVQENYKVVKRKKDKRRDSGIRSTDNSSRNSSIMEASTASTDFMVMDGFEGERFHANDQNMGTSPELPVIEHSYANVTELAGDTGQSLSNDKSSDDPNLVAAEVDATAQASQVDQHQIGSSDISNVMTDSSNDMNSPIPSVVKDDTSASVSTTNVVGTMGDDQGINVDTGQPDMAGEMDVAGTTTNDRDSLHMTASLTATDSINFDQDSNDTNEILLSEQSSHAGNLQEPQEEEVDVSTTCSNLTTGTGDTETAGFVGRLTSITSEDIEALRTSLSSQIADIHSIESNTSSPMVASSDQNQSTSVSSSISSDLIDGAMQSRSSQPLELDEVIGGRNQPIQVTLTTGQTKEVHRNRAARSESMPTHSQ